MNTWKMLALQFDQADNLIRISMWKAADNKQSMIHQELSRREE
jgi:hypothetical protein